MQLRKLLLPGLLSVTLLSGCSLFNSEEDVVKMSPLPTVENQFTPSTSWSTSVGDGIGDFYSNLHPAFADGVVYAADRKGTVKALNAADGKEVWSVNLAEKDGWFSRTPALLSGGITVSGVLRRSPTDAPESPREYLRARKWAAARPSSDRTSLHRSPADSDRRKTRC